MSGYIEMDELQRRKKQLESEVKPKEVGFCSLCCSYCCLLCGGTGVILLLLMTLCMYKQWFFDPAMALPTKNTEKYNFQGELFLVGAICEAIIFVLSIFWVRSVNKKLAVIKAAKEK